MPRLTELFVPMMIKIFGRNTVPKVDRYWRLAMAGDDVAELMIYGVIGQMAWSDEPSLEAKNLVREIEQITASTIRVRINSPGGLVADAVAIYNALQRHPATIETHNDGEASSAGSYLFMSGDKRVMASNALLMIHSAWAFVGGNPKQLRQHAETLDRQNSALVPAYQRSGMAEADVQALLEDGENHWYTAAEAVEAGIATDTDEALQAAAMHDFSTHEPPAALLSSLPHPQVSGTEPPAGTPGSQRPAQGSNAPAGNQGVSPMNWIALAKGMGLKMAANATEADAKLAIIKALNLASDADDDTIGAAVAARNAPQPPPAADDAAIQTAVNNALASDQRRRSDINALFDRCQYRNMPGIQELQANCLNNSATTPEAAGLQLLALMGEQAEPLAAHHVVVGEEAREKRVNAMSQGLMARMGVRGEDYDPQNPFRGSRLVDIGRECLQAQGVNTAGMMPEEIAERVLVRPMGANTTSDFPNVLANTLHKLVLAGFTEVPVTWNQVCRVGDVSDFREWERHVPGMLGNFEGVNERGEYKNKNLADTEKAVNQAVRKGMIIAVTPEVMVNDDIGYIQSQANDLGRSGQRTIDADFYTLLNSNPTVKGQALFHASRNNIAGSGAAPTVELIDAAAVAMAQQRAPAAPGEDAGQLLDIMPDIILANRKRQGDLRVLIGAEYDPDTPNKIQRPNKVRNLVSNVVTSARAAADPWYLFASPNVAPVFEVVFLNGQREPRVVMEENFRTSGLAWKAELPFGIAAIDWRGAYLNPGA